MNEPEFDFEAELIRRFGTSKEDQEKGLAFEDRYRMTWSTLVNLTDTYPQHEAEALSYIKRGLGYSVDPLVYMPHIGFIKALIEQYYRGDIDAYKFSDDIDIHLKHIRNDEMYKEGMIVKPPPRYLERYFANPDPVKVVARKRHCEFLGFEPPVEYSAISENILRRTMKNIQHPEEFEVEFYDVDVYVAELTLLSHGILHEVT